MLKIKVKNIDILPHLMILLFVGFVIMWQLTGRGVIDLKISSNLFGFSAVIIMNLGVLNYAKKIQAPDGIILSNLISTEDIRVPSFKYGGFINQGTNISFVKIYFNKEEAYLYYRNFFPIKIYTGPFIINKQENSLLNNFTIKEYKKTSSTESRISIVSQSGATSYTFYMTNISKRDFSLLDNFFNE